MLVFLISNLASIFCAVVAGYLAYHDKDGWGWFLFVAILLHTTLTYNKNGMNNDD